MSVGKNTFYYKDPELYFIDNIGWVGYNESVRLKLIGDPAPHLYSVQKNTGLDQSVQTSVPFRPPAGRNPDWSIPMSFMQLTTQLIHCHVLICIIICHKPKGNIILLSPLELKTDFISIETLSLIRC